MKLISIVGSANVTLPSTHSKGSSPLFLLLQNNGYGLTSAINGNFLIAINHNSKKYNKFIKHGGKPEEAILLRLEPPSVFPAQYKKKIIKKYGLIISPGMFETGKSSSLFVGWPYEYNLNPNFPGPNDPSLETIIESLNWQKQFQVDSWANRRLKISMIAGNKVGPSKDGNYSIRRKLAHEFPKESLSVYGPLWNESLQKKMHHRAAVSFHSMRNGIFPNLTSVYGDLFRKYPNAYGPVSDKHGILQESKFSLVIENSNWTVSEKLFDSIINGTIPIYVGPNLNNVGLPENIAIVSKGDTEEILHTIQHFDSRMAKEKLDAMKHFLESTHFKDNWTSKLVYKKIFELIQSHIDRIKV
jgi:hypothetical protein